MRKNESGKTDYIKHTRNSKWGRRGVNKRVRKAVRNSIKKIGAFTGG